MSGIANTQVRAVADASEGCVLATVEIAAPPARVFRALASTEVTGWWVRPGIFDTREWTGDVRPSGRWQAAGAAHGRPYALEGEFLTIDAPRALAHTWHGVGAPGAPTTVTYRLEASNGGTHLTLKHAGFASREACEAHCVGWETSLERLAELLTRDP